MRVKNLSILGATGSIGQSTLNLLRLQPERFNVFALSGHHQVDALAQLCCEFQPTYAVLTEPTAAARLTSQLREARCPTQVLTGAQALIDIASAPEVDCVMAAIVGSVGLAPTFAAIKAGKTVYLANKEALVMAGDLMMNAVATHQATLLPVDSEHNALFQCLPTHFLAPRLFPHHVSNAAPLAAGVMKIILTASGGTFRDLALDQFAFITPEQACQHPNWRMGKKITVDSATMMNKALEVIEAHYLFGLAPSQIEVLIHPQSLIHSLVVFADGSQLAQLGEPDMRTPIAHAMHWPERFASGVKTLDLAQAKELSFKAIDPLRYPAFRLGYDALHHGGTAPCILNAANEIAVAAFLNQQIRFNDIAYLNESALNTLSAMPARDFETIMAADAQTRADTKQRIAAL